MKKLISLVLAAAMTVSTCAISVFAEKPSFKVAIVQQLDHPSLDEIRTAAESKLLALADEKDAAVEVKVFNGQNDSSILNQIGAKVVSDGYDAVIPIATLAATCMVTATEETDTPVVYAAISDPESAGLVDIANVTGTSDALNTAFILDMMFAVQPDIKTVGLLYSRSEVNSETPIAQAKEYLDAKGVKYIEKPATPPTRCCPPLLSWPNAAMPCSPPLITWSWPPKALWLKFSMRPVSPTIPARTPSFTAVPLPPAVSTTRSWAKRPPKWPLTFCWAAKFPPTK